MLVGLGLALILWPPQLQLMALELFIASSVAGKLEVCSSSCRDSSKVEVFASFIGSFGLKNRFTVLAQLLRPIENLSLITVNFIKHLAASNAKNGLVSAFTPQLRIIWPSFLDSSFRRIAIAWLPCSIAEPHFEQLFNPLLSGWQMRLLLAYCLPCW